MKKISRWIKNPIVWLISLIVCAVGGVIAWVIKSNKW